MTKESEYNERLEQANDKHAKREERLMQLFKLLETAKSCIEAGKFDMADELFSEFDELSKKEPSFALPKNQPPYYH